MLLEVKNLTVSYDKAIAVNDISFNLEKKGVVCLIGANGAGKTTILRAISGLIPVSSGDVIFQGDRINNLPAAEIVKRGLVHVPQGRKLFPFLTVANNLKMGASARKQKKHLSRDMEEIFHHFPVLKRRLSQKAGTLSGGEQEMLAIGRGLMAKPILLMLDEPSLGLAPIIVNELKPVTRNLNKKGISILLVEQNMPLALEVSNRGYALQVGQIVLEGNIDVFKTDEAVRKAYLGD